MELRAMRSRNFAFSARSAKRARSTAAGVSPRPGVLLRQSHDRQHGEDAHEEPSESKWFCRFSSGEDEGGTEVRDDEQQLRGAPK
jgi:hypothetical protein